MLVLGSPFTDGDDNHVSPGADLVIFTGDTEADRPKSVTIHLYDAKTRQATGSVCLKPVDVSHLRVDSTATPVDAFYVGATPNDVPCADPTILKREQQGRPPPDQRYVNSCYSLAGIQKGSVITFYRFPNQFQDTKPPKCPASQ